MKIRKSIPLEKLKEYGYQYEPNLFYPTYQKRVRYGNKVILIEVLEKDRTIFMNRNQKITKKTIDFLRDLMIDNLIEK